ncbi:MAG: PQQ-dependent sugar dehydrogenase [Hyphomicrobiaceae bacterium]
MRRRSSFAVLFLLFALTSAAAAAVQTDAPRPNASRGARAETVAKGLENPWGLAFLPSGDMLVTERPGRVRYVTAKGHVSPPLSGAPKVVAAGQGGMLDVAVAPDFATSRDVFISFSEARGRGGRTGTSVVRLKLEGTGNKARLTSPQVIFRQQPAYDSGRHFGSRIVFARDGTLFITVGDRGYRAQAQNLRHHVGKIIRINRDGSVPKNNPFVGRKGVQPQIWSYGHRNPQAAALNPATGRLWAVEHGARGGDEINIPAAGKNYGWPVISYGTHYSGQKIGAGRTKAGMEQPIYYWDPSIAPSGMAFYTGSQYPAWRGNLFVGALKFRQIRRLILDGDRVVGEEVLLRGLRQRIRAIRQSPSGELYFLTDSRRGQIMRLLPVR